MQDKKLVVATSSELLRKVKMYAAEHDTTIKVIVETALQQFLGKKGEEAKQ